MDNRFDIVRLIRKARLDNAAKADETDELRENLDFVSLGMISESEPQSNASENTSDIAPKGTAGQGSMYFANPKRKRTRGVAIKRHCKDTGKAASKYDYDGFRYQ